jgi:hypothetical protein
MHSPSAPHIKSPSYGYLTGRTDFLLYLRPDRKETVQARKGQLFSWEGDSFFQLRD